MAFEADYAEICQALLECARKRDEAIIIGEQKNQHGKIALHIAIEQNRVDLAKVLASFGHDIKRRYNMKEFFPSSDAMSYAACYGSFRVCVYFLQAFIFHHVEESLLAAVLKGSAAICELLLADANSKVMFGI